MKSIKRKLFFAILLILSIFILGLLSYSVLFKPYFINSKLKEMDKVILSLDKILSSNDLISNQQYLSDVSDKYNLQIQIVNNTLNSTIYGSHGGGKNQAMGNPNRFQVVKNLGEENHINRSIILDRSTGVEFLSATKTISTLPYSVSIKTPISAIEDSLHKSLMLLSMILIPITILTLIATSYFSKSFTKPIIAITNKTSKIEALDFTEELDIKSNDEIGLLANSINNLSKKIEKSLSELTTKNHKLEDYIEIEKKNELLRKEFVSSVSHELKTPITVISGYAQALDSSIINNDEDRAYYLSVIQNETERMQVIVNDLLDLYKLQSSTFKIKLDIVQLDELMTNILNKLRFKFEDLEIRLSTTIEKTIVLGDAIRLEQAIVNYINNALSHIDSKKELKIKVIHENTKVFISVYNSGENISEEDMEKIWAGFFRVDKVRNFKEKRVGLGLAIVDQIVKLHNGERGVKNTPTGVEFWIMLSSYTNTI